MKKPKANFIRQNGGGSYKLEIYLVENAPENQNAWADAQGQIIFDCRLKAVMADLKKDGFNVYVV